jgi:hypothetical protein
MCTVKKPITDPYMSNIRQNSEKTVWILQFRPIHRVGTSLHEIVEYREELLQKLLQLLFFVGCYD